MSGFAYTSPQSTNFFSGGKRSLFPAGFGNTFVKQYGANQGTLDADDSLGSGVATFTASRGTTTPATTIETQSGNALLFDGVNDTVIVPDASAIQDIFDGGGSLTVELLTSSAVGADSIVGKRGTGKGWCLYAWL